MARKVMARTSPFAAAQNHSDPGPMIANPSMLVRFTTTSLRDDDGRDNKERSVGRQDTEPRSRVRDKGRPRSLPKPCHGRARKPPSPIADGRHHELIVPPAVF